MLAAEAIPSGHSSGVLAIGSNSNGQAVDSYVVDQSTNAVMGHVPVVSNQGGEVDHRGQRKVSFRDTVMRDMTIESQNCPIYDLEVEVTNDFIIGNEGFVPEINFSERVHKYIDEKLANCHDPPP
ncbi:hypothetical protein V6N13_133386 [Hibiscus sabdariffa]|uniref:Uncharacterized protein n=2 Tax=Hibiscus sabdariffa TaxID=183260 RepID=A0ABR1ZA79_9ROSI